MVREMDQAVSGETGPQVKGGGVSRPGRLNHLVYLAAAAISLTAVFNHSVESRVAKTLKAGDSMPSFSLALTDGRKVSQADFSGHPTIYFFYANWCPCSHISVDWIKKAFEDHKAEGLRVLSVGVQDSSDKLKEFVTTHKLPFPACAVGGDDVAASVGVSITPTTVFVGGDGVIKSVYVGKIERYEQIKGGVTSILSRSAPDAVGAAGAA